MQIFKERAEDYSLDELNKLNLDLTNNRLLFHLRDYITNKTQRPMFVVGIQGSGKTANIMKALSMEVSENKDSLPSMFIYQKRKKVESLDPLKLATRETWGQRYEILQSKDMKELMKKANIVVKDDVNYELQGVVRGKVRLEDVASELDELSKESEKGKKVILISQDPLNSYQEILSKKMNTKELDEVLLKFGQMPYYRYAESPEKWGEYMERANILAFREVPPLSREDWEQLFRVYNVDADGPVRSFIYNASNGQPRVFVKIAKIFQEKRDEKVDMNTNRFIGKAIEFLHHNVVSQYELDYDYYLMNFSTIPIFHSDYRYDSDFDNRNEKLSSFIKERNQEMIDAYHNFPFVKDLCRDFLQTQGINKAAISFNDVYVVSKHLSGNPLFSDSMDRNHIYRISRREEFLSDEKDKNKVISDYSKSFVDIVNNPPIFNFLQTFDVMNRHSGAKQKESMLKEELKNMGGTLYFELEGEGYKKSKNFFRPIYFMKGEYSNGRSYEFLEAADHLFLKKPFEVAFKDQLHEVPTLEFLKALGI